MKVSLLKLLFDLFHIASKRLMITMIFCTKSRKNP